MKPSRSPLCHNKEGSINHKVSLSLLAAEGILLFFSMFPSVRKLGLPGRVSETRQARVSLAPPVLSGADFPYKRLLGRPTEIMLSTFAEIMFLTL